MRITIEATGDIQRVNGVAARLWKGRSESGVEVLCWVTLLGAAAAGDQEAFERELQELTVIGHLGAIDLRMVL